MDEYEEKKFFDGVLEAFKNKGMKNPGACQACGKNEYKIASTFATILPYDPFKKKIEGEKGMPYVVVYCENCGYSQFFSTKILELEKYYKYR